MLVLVLRFRANIFLELGGFLVEDCQFVTIEICRPDLEGS